jgi:uncharacterized protein
LDYDLVFDWDSANRDHINRHTVSPEEAEQVIYNNPLDVDAEVVDGESRIASIGWTNQGRFLVVITTVRDARLRVVTAFPVSKNLIELYFKENSNDR